MLEFKNALMKLPFEEKGGMSTSDDKVETVILVGFIATQEESELNDFLKCGKALCRLRFAYEIL